MKRIYLILVGLFVLCAGFGLSFQTYGAERRASSDRQRYGFAESRHQPNLRRRRFDKCFLHARFCRDF